MTPTALTPAGRGTRPKQRQTAKRSAGPARAGGVAQGARTATHGARTAVQGARTAAEGARTAVKGARPPMVSGPAGGRGTGHRAPVRRPSAPRNPRRVSGPARPTRPRSGDQPVVRAPLGARSAAFIRGLPDHALLDRIIRGRYWIPLLGVLLVGIVAMQVEVLKLNAGIGRALEQSTSLQNRNEQLQAAVARGADDQRIESMAAHMGMVMPQPAAIRFLQRHPAADVEKAISNIHVPSATSFQAALTAAGSPAVANSAATTAASTASTSSTSPGA
jgi:cell division protein FtsL